MKKPSSLSGVFRVSLLFTAALWLVAAGCKSSGDLETWNATLKSRFFVESTKIQKNAPQSILLIGENHGSVKTQQQLADLLEALYGANQLDAILVEGSNGEIDAEPIRTAIGQYSHTREFWKGQLDFGHIAGYEYVALTRPGVKIFGIEDMHAKNNYAAGAAGRGVPVALESVLETHRRGLALAKRISATLNTDQLQTSGVNLELKAYEERIDALSAFSSSTGSKYAQAAEDVIKDELRFRTLSQRLMPIFKLLAHSANPKEISEESTQAALKEAGYQKLEDAGKDLQELEQLKKSLEANIKESEKFGTAFEHLDTELLDRYFIVANAVRSASGGNPARELQTFLRDEHERQRLAAEKQDAEVPHLADRDQYMVNNAMSYLNDPQNAQRKRVAMVVGYAHLEHLTQLLRQQDVNVLVGSVAASRDEIEEWENKAWTARSFLTKPVFSAGMKEVSRLSDPIFRAEVPQLLQVMEAATKDAIRYDDNSRVLEWHTPNGSVTVTVTSDVPSLYADWGPYQVGSGTLPDEKEDHYLVFDHKAADKDAKMASTSSVLFASAYPAQGADGNLTTKIDLPRGSVTIDEFKRKPPSQGGKSPSRIVLAPQGDAKPIHNAMGGGPPSWNNPRTRWAEPPEHRGPFLFFTVNIDRAHKNMNALEKQEKQDQLRAGRIASMQLGLPGEQDSSLDQLRFTPSRGDNARALLVVGANTAEFRQKLKDYAKTQLFKNKQVALITCFDVKETAALREMLLQAGAIMVWTPESRISPEAAHKLQHYLERVDTASTGHPPKALDDYIDRALELWHRDAPNDTDLVSLSNSSRWTDLRVPDSRFPKHLIMDVRGATDVVQEGL